MSKESEASLYASFVWAQNEWTATENRQNVTEERRTDFRYGDAELIKVMHMQQHGLFGHEVKVEPAVENSVRFQARCFRCGTLDKNASGMLRLGRQPGATPEETEQRQSKREPNMANETTPASEPETKYCGCGCGAVVARSFLPGHDARHASKLVEAAINGSESALGEIAERGWNGKLAKRQATLAKASDTPKRTGKSTTKTIRNGNRARHGEVDKDKLATATALLNERGIEAGKLDAKEVDEILDGRYFGATIPLHVGDEILFSDDAGDARKQGTILEMDGDKAKVKYNNGTRDYTKVVSVTAIFAAETVAA